MTRKRTKKGTIVMKISKKWQTIAAIIAGIIMGLLATIFGGMEFIHSRQLATRGKTTTGEVLATDDTVTRKFRQHTYWVTVLFQTDSGERIKKKVEVEED